KDLAHEVHIVRGRSLGGISDRPAILLLQGQQLAHRAVSLGTTWPQVARTACLPPMISTTRRSLVHWGQWATRARLRAGLGRETRMWGLSSCSAWCRTRIIKPYRG